MKKENEKRAMSIMKLLLYKNILFSTHYQNNDHINSSEPYDFHDRKPSVTRLIAYTSSTVFAYTNIHSLVIFINDKQI